MSNRVFISICIPAYKHVDYLKRLLDSIAIQTFKDFEVIITDDSPGNEVEQFCLQYQSLLPIKYIKNNTSLGSPGNWNACISNASGQWIKLMHDDDWFACPESLKHFAGAAFQGKNNQFIFSAFTEIDEQKETKQIAIINRIYLALLRSSPLTLFKKNFIGHPSTTLVANNNQYYYDTNFKWVVDIEFYIRYLRKHKNFISIGKPLINIGINKDQITKQAFRNPNIEIPEVFGLFEKLPKGCLKNIFCYDFYWRFIRNLSIKDEATVKKYAPGIEIPLPLKRMIEKQKNISVKMLRKGIVSKTLMFRSYILDFRKF